MFKDFLAMLFDRLEALQLNEKSISYFIPFSSCVAPEVVITKDGDFLATLKLAGKEFETVSNQSLHRDSEHLNNFYKVLAAASSTDVFSIKVHRLRRVIHDSLSVPTLASDFVTGFCRDYNNSVYNDRLMATELYVTLIASKAGLIKKDKKTIEAIRQELDERLEAFRKTFQSLKAALSAYEPTELREFKKDGHHYSEQLSFYNFLITGHWQNVLMPYLPLWEALGNVQVFIGEDTIEFQSARNRTFAQSVELKDYPMATDSALMDGLLYPDLNTEAPYPFVETQTFCLMRKNEGLRVLTRQKNQLLNSGDQGQSQIDALLLALDMVANGLMVMGDYSYSLMVFGDSVDDVVKNTSDSVKKLEDAGFLPVKSTLALGCCYLHQLPGRKNKPRIAKISSQNFSHLSAFHNFPCGKRNHNPWGEAVALLRMPSNQPFYFNFHVTSDKKDSEGEMALGNTSILGASGTGKTALLNFLLFCTQKYRTKDQKLSIILFDKDKGAELAIRAMGGGYLTIENGKPSGINPFQLEANEKNIQFLIRWTKNLISKDGQPISAHEERRLELAVNSLMQLEKSQRRLALLPAYLIQGSTSAEINNSLTMRLRKWIENGPLSWAFDNENNELDLNEYSTFGIDGTDFLDNEEVCGLFTQVILHLIETQVLDGRRAIIVMDEFWKYLRDKGTSEYALNKFKTIRKQNGIFIIATQTPQDIAKSPDGKNFIQNSATQIYLPNPLAEFKDYQEFQVSEKEFNVVKSLPETSRAFLVKQKGSSVLIKHDLSAYRRALKIFSGSTDMVSFAEDLMARFGKRPEQWLPYFFGDKSTVKAASEGKPI